jgi:excinuclease ABC subunit A
MNMPEGLPKTHHLSKTIEVRGAREHNLRALDVTIPKRSLVVFTGPSGSGKSSLAFDTIYAEGRRRYVESLSTYARQFLGQIEKPDFDQILGLSPAISIEQKTTGTNPRSTVGTITEIYDHLRVLYARLGTQHCHKCGEPTSQMSPEAIHADVLELEEGTKFMVLAPLVRNRKGEYRDLFEKLRRQGYARARIDGEIEALEGVDKLSRYKKHDIDVVVDRLVARPDKEDRIVDSLEMALRLGDGRCVVSIPTGDGESQDTAYSVNRSCVSCHIAFPEPSHQTFSFNSAMGMCTTCQGLGELPSAVEELIVLDESKSVREGALEPLGPIPTSEAGEGFKHSKAVKSIWSALVGFADAEVIDLDVPFAELSEQSRRALLHGPEKKTKKKKKQADFQGVCAFVEEAQNTASRKAARSFFEEFVRPATCPTCEGTRLRAKSRAVYFRDASIADLGALGIEECLRFFEDVELDGKEAVIGTELVKEIRDRLGFLLDVGLGYLSLDRTATTLSGGESQRIRLARQLGSELSGILYILDEPSIGLHQRDNLRLLETLAAMRDRGNSVIVVEHDRETMEIADHILDFGPGAGRDGGEIVAQGPPEAIRSAENSVTGDYLAGRRNIEPPAERRQGTGEALVVRGAQAQNLEDIDVRIPEGCFVCVTGVSGAGKSTLVNEIVYPAVAREVYFKHRSVGTCRAIEGIELFDKVIEIDQRPIGRTPRSNPATYTKVFDYIRELYANLPSSKMYGFDRGRFSFNVKGGRCEECKGAGSQKIEMTFLADVYVPCEVCLGKRFNAATLRVRYHGHTIADVLDMTIAEAAELFSAHPKIMRRLDTLLDVGLDYIKLGQPSPTLSGGEAQRVKLSRELAKIATGDTLYILDEPSTGLHFQDIERLLAVIDQLVDAGNTVLMIEHNLDIIQYADYLIDLGPEGGAEGGELVACGTPEEVAEVEASATGRYLREIL